MTQKVIKIGTSAGVTISKSALKELGLEAGDKVEVLIDKKHKSFVIKPLVEVDKELVEWTSKFVGRYKKDLEALAKK